MKKTFTIAIFLLSVCLGAFAQSNFRAGYFMDGYLYNHTMNPAFYANKGYVSVGVGNISLNTQSNLGVSTFLYPTGNGKSEFFLSDNVSSSSFLKKIHANNFENVSLGADLVSFGFWTKRNHFHSFSASVQVMESVSAPYDVFRFLKEGTTNGTGYDLSGFGGRMRGYVQLAYGMSVPLTDNIRVGGKVKTLVGLVYMDARFNKFDVNLSGERWNVSTDGILTASNVPATQKGGSVPISDVFNFDNFDVESMRPSGFGMAVDLGVKWDVLPWLEVSGSIVDLGFLGWKLDTRMATGGSWEYTGFDNIEVTGEGSYQDQLDRKMEELDQLVEFHKSDSGSPMTFMPATIYAGAKAKPNSWFSAGLLGTARLEGKYSWAEIRASANLEPTHWFGFSASAAYGSFGPKISTALNLRAPVVALFFGGELSSFNFVSTNPDGSNKMKDIFNGDSFIVPRGRLNMNLVFGLNFVFGKPTVKRSI